MKQSAEVFRGGIGDLLRGDGEEAGEGLGGTGDEGRFVAFAAVGCGGEPGGIGLDKDAVEGELRGDVAQGLGLGVGEVAGEGDEKAAVERAAGLFIARAEAMHDAAEAGVAPVGIKGQEKMVPGVGAFVGAAAVDGNRALAGGGYFKQTDEAGALDVVGCALMVVVEADLATGDDFRLGEQGIEAGEDGVVEFGRIVRVDAGAGIETRHAGLAVEQAAEVEGLVHLGGTFTDADGEHGADAGIESAAEHGFAVFRVARAVEMGVGIDEQGKISGMWKAMEDAA